MASLVTLTEIQTRSRHRADMVSGSFITNDEHNFLINASYKKLWDKLRSAYGGEYAVSSSIIALTGTFSGSLGGPYSLPSNFLDLHGMDVRVSNGDWSTMGSFMMKERNRRPHSVSPYGSYRYKLINNGFYIQPPPPSSGVDVQIWYTPVCPTLVSGSDTVDGVNGWEEYIVIDTAIQMLAKQDDGSSTIFQSLMKERSIIDERIETLAPRRDVANSFRQVDVGYDDLPCHWRQRG